MHPTIDEQLAGARRLLEEVAAEPGLPDAGLARLANVDRLLRRVAGTWATVLDFLVSDSDATARLLTDLAPRLPASLAVAVHAELALASRPDIEATAVDAANARNQRLRALLADAVPLLGDEDRRAVGRHLRNRLEHDPTTRRLARRPS